MCTTDLEVNGGAGGAIIGALAFMFIMMLMCLSLAKAAIRDAIRDVKGIAPVGATAAEEHAKIRAGPA